MKLIRRVLFIGVPLMLLLLFTGCGADVATTMSIDNSFNGSRTITLNLDSSDLGYIEGGFSALDNIVKHNIPADMTYKSSDTSDGKQLTFTVTFADVAEYRTKVEAILAAGVTDAERQSATLLVPEIFYEHNDSYFKSGTAFNENFTSMDLLDWLVEAMRKSKLVTADESNWYSDTACTLVLNGVEHSTPKKISYSETDYSCLQGCEVETTLDITNLLTRTIVLHADEYTVNELAEKGCELESYLRNLAPSGVSMETVNNDGNYSYVFTVTADNAQALLSATNAILQTDTNALTLQTAANDERPGYAVVDISEAIDGSYYLDYSDYYSPVQSIWRVYNNADVVSFDNAAPQTGDNFFSYSPLLNTTYNYQLEWLIEFASASLDFQPQRGNKLDFSLSCTLPEALAEELKLSAIERIRGLFEDESVCTVSEDNVLTLHFVGNTEDVTAQIRTALADDSAFSVEKTAFHTPSFFTCGTATTITYDFTPWFGNVEMHTEDSKNLLQSQYYISGVSVNDPIRTKGVLTVFHTSLWWPGIILVAVSVFLVLIGLILLISSILPLIRFFKAVGEKRKAKKAAKAAKKAAASAEEAPAEETPAEETPAEETPAEEAPAEEAAAPVQSTEEEEQA